MTEAPAPLPSFLLCSCCLNRIKLTEHPSDAIECDRCGHTEKRLQEKSAAATFIFSLTALIFFVPANVFPFMTIELYGNRNSTTIWDGVVSLAQGGSWAIAGIVFLASLVIPLLKILSLFYLSYSASRANDSRFNTKLYQITEALGRWSMLDIFLLAILVAIMKLGPWTTVEPEAGSLLFALVVIFTMLASSRFDPKLLWENPNENDRSEKI